jgi:hypothetical protein
MAMQHVRLLAGFAACSVAAAAVFALCSRGAPAPAPETPAAALAARGRRPAAVEYQQAEPDHAVNTTPTRTPCERGDAVRVAVRVPEPEIAFDVLGLSDPAVALALDPAQVAALHRSVEATILDARTKDSQKVEAHGRLRWVAGDYSAAALAELIRIGARSADAALRADVWRLFDGASTPPALMQPLLTALARDGSPIVRSEAAETLGHFLGDPRVVAALNAATQDADPDVQAKARRTLSGALPSARMLQQTRASR